MLNFNLTILLFCHVLWIVYLDLYPSLSVCVASQMPPSNQHFYMGHAWHLHFAWPLNLFLIPSLQLSNQTFLSKNNYMHSSTTMNQYFLLPRLTLDGEQVIVMSSILQFLIIQQPSCLHQPFLLFLICKLEMVNVRHIAFPTACIIHP